MKTFGYSGENNILVLELLGKSLENLFQDNTGKFSLKTVCMLAIQMVNLFSSKIYSRKKINFFSFIYKI